MTHSKNNLTISFVSGKGGVGKTMLAANVAWKSSKVAKTLLIDMDFHNQGCSGLMAPHFDLESVDAFSAIGNPLSIEKESITYLQENLYFVPAISWKERPYRDLVRARTNDVLFIEHVNNLIKRCRDLGFEIIVFDCHGGLDAASFAAHRLSDITFMVTEADSVTFAGTLELLSYYQEQSAVILNEMKGDDTGKESSQVANVKFIVNRLPNKYRYRDLERLYKPYFLDHLGDFTEDESIFCYIPSEELLADSFGEYPFHAEIAPQSVYTKKVDFICHSILKGIFDIPTSAELSMGRRKKDRIKREVSSQESRNINSIMNFFAWASITTIFAALFALRIVIGRKEWDIYTATLDIGGSLFLFLCGIPTVYFFVRGLAGITLYFRRRYLYQKRLYRALRRRMSIWQWLALSRSFLLRWSTTIGIFVLAIYGILLLAETVEGLWGLILNNQLPVLGYYCGLAGCRI